MIKINHIIIKGLVIILAVMFAKCKKDTFYTEIQNGIIVHSESWSTRVLVYSPEILRITRTNNKVFPEHKSLAVIAKPDSLADYEVTVSDSGILLSTNRLKVLINQKGHLRYMDDKTSELLTETHSIVNDTVDKLGNSCKNMQVNYKLSSSEGIYGLGQHQNNIMNYRGHEVRLVQTNTVAVVPFVLSTKSWGILWDNYSDTRINNKDDREVLKWWCEDGHAIDYYFISGNNPDQVVAGYRELTGDAPLYGKWAYGYWQSKERYKNRDELLSTAMKFRNYQFPIDNIVQDWRYWGNHGWSACMFDTTIFPRPSEMIDSLHNNHFHLMISVWSVFGKQSPVYKEMEKNNLLFPTDHWSDGRFYDPFSEKGRQIYWKHLNKGLFSKGVDAWWMDGTEPEFKPANSQQEVHDFIVENGNTALGQWTQYLNAFSLMTVKAAYEGQRAITDKKRVFILTRSSFAGQQRYAGAAWSGDISANYKVLETQIASGINYCMSGLPYWTTDIGAFHAHSLYPKGCKDDAYKELYVRWFQYGTFCPLFRSHGTNTPREPWQFGEPGTWAYDALLKFANLRYRLMPYIYSLAWQVTNNRYTMMRGLPMAFPDDTTTYSIGNSFMFGNEFLVAPVTENFYHRSSVEGKVIPTENFIDDNEKKGGLTAVYYNGINFNKETNKKVDSELDISWVGAPPVGCKQDSFSVRWTGSIRPNESGKHKLILRYRRGVRLWLNNKLLIDQWEAPYTNPAQTTVNLEKGIEYPIKIEYFEDRSWPFIRLSWETPTGRKEAKLQLEKEKIRKVYLPKGKIWTDFWTGKTYKGGQTIETKATIDIMPLFVKAGSIIPFGPYLQYTDEIPADTLEIRIYPGDNAEFTLYEDEGDNYNYEKGSYATIRFHWNDSTKTCTIGRQKGSFQGMLKKRILHLILVSDDTGTGVATTHQITKSVEYNGEEIKVKF